MSEQTNYTYQRQQMPDRLPEPPQGRGAWWKSIILRNGIDKPFLLLTILLLAVGLIMLFSASYADAYYGSVGDKDGPDALRYVRKQFRFSLIGFAAMAVASLVPLKLVNRIPKLPLNYICVLFAVAVLGVMKARGGLSENGAERWTAIGGQNFQPSELVKAAMVVGFASQIAKKGGEMQKNRSIFWFLASMLIVVVLLLLQPHLSAAIIILMLGALMMFAGGTRWYWFVGVAVALAAAVILIRMNPQEVIDWISKLPEDGKLRYALNRISAWLDPQAQKLSGGWQILQSLYAIGSGGLLGLGLGNSRQKYMYLPEEQNDYIFPIVCEELGFIGAALILLLFALLILRGFWLAIHCRDRFEKMIIIGYTGLLAIQVFLNVGVVTNMLPSTGISLPFFSAGGSALVVQMGEIGLILSASRSIQDK